MKRGLHLGPKPPHTRTLARLLLVVLVAALGLQGARFLEARREVIRLRSELTGLEARAGAPEPDGAAGGAMLASRLRAVVASGALDAFPPTALLDLLQDALPDGVVVSGLAIQAAPSAPSLTVDAVARTADAVTELQRRMDASPLVRATSVLDERRVPDGALAVRLQVDLDRGGLP